MNMKKALALLLAIALAGCDLFEGGKATETYEPLLIRTTYNGEEVEIEISTTRTVPRVVLTPESGDSYVLRVNGRERSRGTIVIDEGRNRITFHPTSGEPFVGSYDTGEGFEVTLYEAPTEGGGVVVGGGGPISPGAPRPPALTVARTADEVIMAFGGGNAIKDGNTVIVVGNVAVTGNLTVETPIVVDRSVPVVFTISPGRVLTVKGPESTDNKAGSVTVTGKTGLEIAGGGTFKVENTKVEVETGGTVTVGANSALEIDGGSAMTVGNSTAVSYAAVTLVGNGELIVPSGSGLYPIRCTSLSGVT